MDFPPPKGDELSASEKARIERNRQKALLLRQEKASKRFYTQTEVNTSKDLPKDEYAPMPKKIDCGGGFLLEDNSDAKVKLKVVHKPGSILLKSERPVCDECEKTFSDSYLYDNFTESVCDGCRDYEEKHRLITKSEAKESYLLKDCDLDLREPPLKFLLKKNTRQPRHGEMKLYLECQVARRAAEVWGSDEKLEEEKVRRSESRDKMKKKKFNKKMEDLRKTVRSSLYNKSSKEHEHEFGNEIYREVDDTYSKTCKTCGHVMSYEKL